MVDEIIAPPADNALIDFLSWLKAVKARYWVGVVGVWGFINAIPKIKPLARFLDSIVPASIGATLPSAISGVLPDALNCALILFGVCLVHSRNSAYDHKFPEAAAASVRLKFYWQWIWILWLIFYAIMLWTHAKPAALPADIWNARWSVLLNFTTNLQAAIFMCAYAILHEPTADGKPAANKLKLSLNNVPWPMLFAIAIVIVLVQGGIVYSGTNSSTMPPTFSFNLFGHALNAKTITFIFELMTGVWMGIAVALFIGRFEGKIMNMPRPFMILMYAYAVIQTVWPVLADHHAVAWLVITACGFLKLALFVAVYWFLNTANDLFYFQTITVLHQDLLSQRINFGKLLRSNAQFSLNASRSEYDIFLSAPMAAYAKDEFEKSNKQVVQIIDVIRNASGLDKIYYAGAKMKDGTDFELADDSLQSDANKINASRFFVLLYPKKLASSALVEAGMAFAYRKPSLYLVREGVDLPFLLKQADKASRKIRIETYPNNDWLHEFLETNAKKIFAKLALDGA